MNKLSVFILFNLTAVTTVITITPSINFLTLNRRNPFILIVCISIGSISLYASQPANPATADSETTKSHSGLFFTEALLVLFSLSAGISAKRIYEIRRAAFEEVV